MAQIPHKLSEFELRDISVPYGKLFPRGTSSFPPSLFLISIQSWTVVQIYNRIPTTKGLVENRSHIGNTEICTRKASLPTDFSLF